MWKIYLLPHKAPLIFIPLWHQAQSQYLMVCIEWRCACVSLGSAPLELKNCELKNMSKILPHSANSCDVWSQEHDNLIKHSHSKKRDMGSTEQLLVHSNPKIQRHLLSTHPSWGQDFSLLRGSVRVSQATAFVSTIWHLALPSNSSFLYHKK